LDLHLKDLDLKSKDLDLEVLSASPFSSALNSTKELVAYLCIHCVLTRSAASTDATIAKLLGKYLLAELAYTAADSSTELLVF